LPLAVYLASLSWGAFPFPPLLRVHTAGSVGGGDRGNVAASRCGGGAPAGAGAGGGRSSPSPTPNLGACRIRAAVPHPGGGGRRRVRRAAQAAAYIRRSGRPLAPSVALVRGQGPAATGRSTRRPPAAGRTSRLEKVQPPPMLVGPGPVTTRPCPVLPDGACQRWSPSGVLRRPAARGPRFSRWPGSGPTSMRSETAMFRRQGNARSTPAAGREMRRRRWVAASPGITEKPR